MLIETLRALLYRIPTAYMDNRGMLAYQDVPARRMFAVYIRPEGEHGSISFFADEEQATAEAGPGMPVGVITHGDTYIEHIGDVLLFAPADWPLADVDQDLLVELDTGDVTVFVALTPEESEVLLALAATRSPEAVDDSVPAPAGLTGDSAAVAWLADGSLIAFENGFSQGGRRLATTIERGDFDDEIRADQAVVAILDDGQVPRSDDEFTWREEGDVWVINTQPRVSDASEQFLCRYTVDDQTLVVARSATDTDNDEHHLQVVNTDLDLDFIDLGRALVAAGWRIDDESGIAARLSANPALRQSPGWYPAEAIEGESDPKEFESVTEWICNIDRR